MSENSELRRTLDLKNGVTGGWIKIHCKVFLSWNYPPNIIVIKSRRLSWARQASRIGVMD
jgi:hypothetical protein